MSTVRSSGRLSGKEMSAAGGGGCLLPEGSGCLLPGGVCSGGCLLPRGVSAPGGGVCSGGCSPPCTEADTPPVDRQTPVKT